jgi:hypothetical protein
MKWDVQQKIKHRYFTEDQRRPQETRSGRVYDIKEQRRRPDRNQQAQQRWRVFVVVLSALVYLPRCSRFDLENQITLHL